MNNLKCRSSHLPFSDDTGDTVSFLAGECEDIDTDEIRCAFILPTLVLSAQGTYFSFIENKETQ